MNNSKLGGKNMGHIDFSGLMLLLLVIIVCRYVLPFQSARIYSENGHAQSPRQGERRSGEGRRRALNPHNGRLSRPGKACRRKSVWELFPAILPQDRR